MDTPSPKKKKWIWLTASAAAVLLLAIAGTICWKFTADPDAGLPPEEKVRRNFQKAFDPKQSTLDRLTTLRRSFKAAKDIPPEKRHPIIVEALAESVNRTFTEFAKLPPEQKARRAEEMRLDAERTEKYFRRFSKKTQRKALSLLANTPGGRAQINRAIDTTSNVLSPEDRKLLGPAVKIWKSMLEEVK